MYRLEKVSVEKEDDVKKSEHTLESATAIDECKSEVKSFYEKYGKNSAEKNNDNSDGKSITKKGVSGCSGISVSEKSLGSIPESKIHKEELPANSATPQKKLDNNISVDPNTGNVSWKGRLFVTKGDHSHMPSRTDAYLPGDERGHLNASSLSGPNTPENVVAQHHDVNHGAYYSMERGERSALKNGADIDSSKTAIVNAKPGSRPEAFIVSDTVTYPDNHTESIYHSFTNASYEEQQEWNDQSVIFPDTFDAPNPGNPLADSMSSAEYAELMESTDAELPDIYEDYAASDFSGVPFDDSDTSDVNTTASGESESSFIDADK